MDDLAANEGHEDGADVFPNVAVGEAFDQQRIENGDLVANRSSSKNFCRSGARTW